MRREEERERANRKARRVQRDFCKRSIRACRRPQSYKITFIVCQFPSLLPRLRKWSGYSCVRPFLGAQGLDRRAKQDGSKAASVGPRTHLLSISNAVTDLASALNPPARSTEVQLPSPSLSFPSPAPHDNSGTLIGSIDIAAKSCSPTLAQQSPPPACRSSPRRPRPTLHTSDDHHPISL